MAQFISTVNEADAYVRLFFLGTMSFLALTERLAALGAYDITETHFTLLSVRFSLKGAL